MRRYISMVRALQRSILGRNAGASLRSISVQRMPRLPRSMASVSPTGPAPTMTTSESDAACMSAEISVGARETFPRYPFPRHVGPADFVAPVLPAALEGEAGASLRDRRDLAVGEIGHFALAERQALHQQVGVHLHVDGREDHFAQVARDAR